MVKNEFENEEKKIVCAWNKANRTKNPNRLNHHFGPRPLSHRANDHLTKGHSLPFCQTALDAYFPCKNDTEQVEKLKRKCEEVVQAQEGSSEAQAKTLSVEDRQNILIECFGERQGTKVKDARQRREGAQ